MDVSFFSRDLCTLPATCPKLLIALPKRQSVYDSDLKLWAVARSYVDQFLERAVLRTMHFHVKKKLFAERQKWPFGCLR